MNSIGKVQNAWRTAAAEIGFQFTCPYSLNDGSEQVQYHGFVRGFGSSKGTVFLACSAFGEEIGAAGRLAGNQGYFFAMISAAGYSSYQRAHFTETLKDWGWQSFDLAPPHGFARPIKTEKRNAPNQSAQPTRQPGG